MIRAPGAPVKSVRLRRNGHIGTLSCQDQTLYTYFICLYLKNGGFIKQAKNCRATVDPTFHWTRDNKSLWEE